MKSRPVGSWALGIAIMLLLLLLRGAAAQGEPVGGSSLAAEEREGCRRNLKVVYDAIQAYQFDHKDLPNWLSDLVPDYISDGNTLICPVCRRTGRTERPPLADPKLACSYVFEFSPVPLAIRGRREPAPTRRDWKRRQMGLIGSVVPVVRCRHHDPVLNLAFNGTIYDSPSDWELVFTNRIHATELSISAIFGDGSGADDLTTSSVERIPIERKPALKSPLTRTIDLHSFYNSDLNQPLQGKTGDDLASLPKGALTLDGVLFEIGGVIQLGPGSGTQARLPAEVKSIPVHQHCQHLYFLHAASGTDPILSGTQIGSYNVHLSRPDVLLEIPIYLDRTVADWHGGKLPAGADKELRVAWVGENSDSKLTGSQVRLFVTAWNLAPGVDVDTLDFVSAGKSVNPFVVAISYD